MKKTSLGKEKAFKNAAVLFAVTVLFTGCGSMSTDSGSIKTAASNSSVGSYYESAAYGEESAVRLVNQRKHIQSQIHHTAAHTVAEEARKILRQDQQVVQQPVSVAV